MSKKNPSVLWTVSQNLEKSDKEIARANLGLNISSSSSTTGNTLSFVDAISEDSTTGNLTYSKKSVTVDQDTYSAADPSGNPASAKTIKKAIETLDGGKDTETGYYVKHVKQTDGVVTVTTEAMDTSPTANSTKPVTSGGVHSAIQTATSAMFPDITSQDKVGNISISSDGGALLYKEVATISYTVGSAPVCITGRVVISQYGYQNPVTINYRLLWNGSGVTKAYYDIMSGNEAQISLSAFRLGYIYTSSTLSLYIKLRGYHVGATLLVDMVKAQDGSMIGTVAYNNGTATSTEPSGIAYMTPRYNRISTIMGFLPGQWGPDESPVPSSPYMYWLMDIVMDGTYKSITLDCLWHQGLGAYENYLPTHINIYLSVGGTAGTLSDAIVTSSDMMSYYGTLGTRPDSLVCAWVHGANEPPKLRLYSVGIPNANYQQSFEVLSVSTNCTDSPVFYSYTANDSQNFRDTFTWSVQTLSLRRALWADTTTLPIGSTSTPVYINTDGVPQTCGKVTSASSADNADTVDNYHISVGYSSASNTICFY